MKNTAFNKNLFIKAVFLANQEIYKYINLKLSQKDLQYSNNIGFGGDNSLNMDLLAEQIFIKHLKNFGNIYSEECGFLDFSSEYTIIIDPLDGSNNFTSNIPYYGTSVALKKADNIIAGFVANLSIGELVFKILDDDLVYISLKDLNKIKKIESQNNNIAIFERAYDFPKICKSLYKKDIKFRSLGATALSLANAKNYKFVLIAGKIRNFDIDAALYISKDLFIYKNENYLLISKNSLIFKQIKEIIKD